MALHENIVEKTNIITMKTAENILDFWIETCMREGNRKGSCTTESHSWPHNDLYLLSTWQLVKVVENSPLRTMRTQVFIIVALAHFRVGLSLEIHHFIHMQKLNSCMAHKDN